MSAKTVKAIRRQCFKDTPYRGTKTYESSTRGKGNGASYARRLTGKHGLYSHMKTNTI